jgi:uncharacterized protein with PIN domain
MLNQSWSLGSTVPALCPKCHAEALHRSHAHTPLEEKRKQVSSKRPFRCHECQWRGWLEETQLRYSASVVKNRAATNPEYDVDIPEIVLDDGKAPEAHRRKENALRAENPSSVAPASEATTMRPKAEVIENVAAQDAHTTEAQPSFPETASMSEVEELPELPSFDDSAGAPVSRTVDTAFHHHARHTAKQCPGCGESTLFRSRSRTFSENVKKRFTNKRLYRCHRCGWRGWMSRGF